MGADWGKQIGKIARTALFQGKAAAVSQAQRFLIPHVLDVFADHSADDVYKFIVTDYALVEQETPEAVRNGLYNLAQNARLRDMYHRELMNRITPENILHWMRNPEEWLDEEDAIRQREELKECARVIEQTEGGMAWLEQQVLTVYQFADMVPEDSSTRVVNR